MAAAGSTAGFGACSGDGGRPPEPVQRPPVLAGAAVTPGAVEVPLDSAVALRAEPAWSGAASAAPSVTVTWALRGTAGGAVTPDGGDGRSATYRAGGPGADTLTASVAPSSDGPAVTAAAVVVVRGPRVAHVAFPARVAYVGVGGTLALPAAGRDAAGAAVPRAVVTYRALDPGVTTVGADGTLTGVAVGTTRVIAEASTAVVAPAAAPPTDTVRVVVAGDRSTPGLALADTVVQAGRGVRLVGAELAGAAATLDGAALAVSGTPDGAVAAVPLGAFPTCRALGSTVAFAVTVAGRTRAVALPVYAPYVVALAPGQHRRLTDPAAVGCPIAVDQAGTYVAMPFAWDRQLPGGGTAGGGAQAPLTALRLTAGAPDVGASVAAAARNAAAAVPPTGLAARASSDVVRLATATSATTTGAAPRRASVRATSPASWTGGSCPIPTRVGETVHVGTLRDASGRFLQAASVNGGATSEPWTLAAITPSVAVFFDSALVRAAVPGAQGRAQAFAAAYDSTVAPLLAQLTEGVPDVDGTGRVVVLVALHAGSAFAYPTGYGRPDCAASVNGTGEAINLGGEAFVAGDDRVAPAVSVAMHESAHLVDNGQRYMRPSVRQDTWWSVEGYAVLMQYLWSLGPTTPADVFTANRSQAAYRTILGTAQGGFCERPDRAILSTWYTLSTDGYPLACQAVRYALGQLATRQPGLSPKDLLVRWSQLRDRRRFTDAMNGLLGESRPAQDVAGEWYLSWVADGVVATAPTLQDPAADLRSLFRVWWPQTPYPATAATLTPGQALITALGEPDALHVQVTLPARGWIVVTGAGSGGLPVDRADLMMLRVR